MAKPWAPSHISEVAKGLGIDHRISGEVKEKLVEILHLRLKEITKQMEEETLLNEPGKKTLSDPNRTRLGFSRTRGLMIEVIENVESVSSAAVVNANEILESYLQKCLLSAAEEANNENVGTIKIRHMTSKTIQSNNRKINETPLNENKDSTSSLNVKKIETLSPINIKNIMKQLSGKKIDDDAVEELLLLYYDYASDLEYSLQKNIRQADVSSIKNSLDKYEKLMMLGWMRRILKSASKKADYDNSNSIKIEHIVAIDPWT
tara:strand:- start:11657 stop:12442 length:786 start_codon:yes stop_codon:yes gene_type:complete